MIVLRNLFQKELSKLYSEQICSFSRWSSRTPKRIYTPEEYDHETDTISEKPNDFPDSEPEDYKKTFSFQKKIAASRPEKKTQTRSRGGNEILTLRSKNKTKAFDMLETVIDKEGNLVFTKMEDNDARVARVLSNLKSENILRKKESILLEGKRLIMEALRAGCKLQYILFSRKTDIEDLKSDLPKMGAQIYKVPYNEMQMWSNLSTCPGIMGVFKIPEEKDVAYEYEIPVNIICDNIREPGNLGAILRTSAGVGVKSVVLTKGCCDLWNMKVLRSAMGAHFKVDIKKNTWDELRENHSNSSWFIAENQLVKTEENSTVIVDLVNHIPTVAYDQLEYSGSKEISLIIGGETEGISQEAYELVAHFGGMRINVPLKNNIDSLNSGTALGVLVFEMRRQLNK